MSLSEQMILLLGCSLGQPRSFHASASELMQLDQFLTDQNLPDDTPLSRQLMTEAGFSAERAGRFCALLQRSELLENYLSEAHRLGVQAVTWKDPGYPVRIRNVIGSRSPAVFFCAGQLSLLNARCTGLAGSRDLNDTGRNFAENVGFRCAEEDIVLCTGGARGADTAALHTCLASGGMAVCFLADSLADRLHHSQLHENEVLVSEDSFRAGFHTGRAYSRNRLIHACGEKTWIAQVANGYGGTWQGCSVNLKEHLSRLMVCDDGSAGAQDLISRGAIPVPPPGPEHIA